MAIYLKKFETQAAYEAAESSLILPNVSLTVDNNTVHYNPSSPTPPTPVESVIIAKFQITSTSEPTMICSGSEYGEDYSSAFTSIEVDGVMLPTVSYLYQFDTLGEHTVKYTLADPTIISDSSFAYCSGLTSIDIPNSVTSINNTAFQQCESLSSVTIGSGVTTIGSSSFENCYSLTSINIPSGVTSIREGAFCNCDNLDAASIAAIEAIGSRAFDCS